ncbi:MAG: 2-amino-4-hydroxy-6-hydroxymethyldihydropteridine diphosphokinase [Planctomycetes bacterium]|nr:2-amino-4-hydroxy-6-hydroxymethyldihydropteridine diphosphokinase [Planctomycetota bacterium]
MRRCLVYIALGSNRGDRRRYLQGAMQVLNVRTGTKVLKISDLIETQPVGGPPGQEPFLNGAAEIQTTLSPADLLDALHMVEFAMGRERADEVRWGPRTCDLDILLMGRLVLNTENLVIPHPRMHERLFVLQPLAQIAPDAYHPVLKKTVSQMLAELQAAHVVHR